jgi:3',5'-cyclic AMP phosphodiesterase CpdA
VGQGTFAGDTDPEIYSLEDGPNQIVLIPLDTNLETETDWDLFCGAVGARQLSFLGENLAELLDKKCTKILYLHHHPFIHSAIKKLKDADALLQTIKQKVDIVCFGHDHVSGRWKDRDGIDYFLAADKSPVSDRFREINIKNGDLTITEITWPANERYPLP